LRETAPESRGNRWSTSGGILRISVGYAQNEKGRTLLPALSTQSRRNQELMTATIS
jgi:DNA primase